MSETKLRVLQVKLHTAVRVTHLGVDPLEGRVILVHLEVDLGGGDGQSPPGHQDRGDELGRAAQNHGACRAEHDPSAWKTNIYI